MTSKFRAFIRRTIAELLFPGIVQAPAVSMAGAIPDGSFPPFAAAMQLNGASAAGNVNFTSVAGATTTLTAVGEALVLLTNGGAVTVTVDSAYNIGLRLPQPLAIGQTFRFRIATIAATTVATPTLSDTAVTLAGTTSMVANSVREYLGTVTQVNSSTGVALTAGSTFTSLTQVGSTNNYTVVLGTNAVAPVVGQLVYLGVTAGTLPAGWYPVNKVTSATSFVIAAPTAAAAWTATAATMTQPSPVPSTYSPLITLTGLMSVAGTVTA